MGKAKRKEHVEAVDETEIKQHEAEHNVVPLHDGAVAPRTKSEAAQDRRKSRIDVDANTVTALSATDEVLGTYSADHLPDRVLRHLALVGLWAVLRQAKDADATLKILEGGDLPGRTKAEPRLKGSDAWREAYARFKVERDDISIEKARGRAAEIDKADLKKVMRIGRVVDIHAELTGVDLDID